MYVYVLFVFYSPWSLVVLTDITLSFITPANKINQIFTQPSIPSLIFVFKRASIILKLLAAVLNKNCLDEFDYCIEKQKDFKCLRCKSLDTGECWFCKCLFLLIIYFHQLTSLLCRNIFYVACFVYYHIYS